MITVGLYQNIHIFRTYIHTMNVLCSVVKYEASCVLSISHMPPFIGCTQRSQVVYNAVMCSSSELLTHTSGSFRAARLPGQATCAARAVSFWVEKNPVPPPNRRALDWLLSLLSDGSAPSPRKTI